MAALTDQFETALTRIEPSDDDRDHAPEAHEDVQGVLEDDGTLSGWGISPVLIGSYKRHVSIRRVKDVDVFCRLKDLPADVDPQDLLDQVFEILDNHYGKTSDGKRRAKRQDRSVQVLFPEYDGLYVDAVPARPRSDGTWEIPEHSDADEPWQRTNPEKFTSLSSTMNTDHFDLYVPTVKLIRQTRRHLLGKRPGGLWFEMALYEACRQGLVPPKGNIAEHYTTGLEAIADLLDAKVDDGTDLTDPTMDGEVITVRATDTQWETARDKFRAAAATARAAYDSTDRCAAAVKYRSLLGSNDDYDPIFPLPGDCNDDGTRKWGASLVTAGEEHVPAGNRRSG